jgi:hypothetical protein
VEIDEPKLPKNLNELKNQSLGVKKDKDKKFVPKQHQNLSQFEKDQLAKGFGVKADSHKPRMDLIPPEVMFGYGNALGYGARKYSDNNWLNGMDWSRMFAAAQRHIWAWWAGQEKDEESNLHHLESALFSIAALYTYEKRKLGNDNRKKLTKKQIEDIINGWKKLEELDTAD